MILLPEQWSWSFMHPKLENTDLKVLFSNPIPGQSQEVLLRNNFFNDKQFHLCLGINAPHFPAGVVATVLNGNTRALWLSFVAFGSTMSVVRVWFLHRLINI